MTNYNLIYFTFNINVLSVKRGMQKLIDT